jgi:hypothetical protein
MVYAAVGHITPERSRSGRASNVPAVAAQFIVLRGPVREPIPIRVVRHTSGGAHVAR